MANPRRIALSSTPLDIVEELSTAAPPQNALFWHLWQTCKKTAVAALETDYIQGIGAGSLDPTQYGAFNVLDAYYCFKGADAYAVAAKRATDPILKLFLTKKHESYQKYNTSFSQTWHIRDASSVIPNTVCKKYAQLEADVAAEEAPIYSLIVMLPCEYLWYWLSDQLYPPQNSNLYGFWINENHYVDGAYKMGNFIELYQQQRAIDFDKALHFYSRAMQYEQQNFAMATTEGA